MKSSVVSRVAAQKRFARAGAVAPTRVAFSVAAPVKFAAPIAARVSRTSAVVVKAAKVSVGDLKKADLEGKRVFVRAGEQIGGSGQARMGCSAMVGFC